MFEVIRESLEQYKEQDWYEKLPKQFRLIPSCKFKHPSQSKTSSQIVSGCLSRLQTFV